MKKILKAPAMGFTLVELMVVVAIIGILSAIAVPNFKKYQAKSKQSEAKIQLAAVYNTEVGANADYDLYAACISDLGYETNPKGYYTVGFSAADSTATITTITTRAGTTSACSSSNYFMTPTNSKKVAGSFAGSADLASVAPTNTTFVAGATGNISGTAFDKWTINEGKNLTNTSVGY